MPDASRSVAVAQGLLGEAANDYVAEVQADYDKVRALHAGKKQTPLWPLAKARANKTPVDWAAYQPTAPKFLGRRILKNYDLAEIAQYIDWGPFFQTWDLAGAYPAILDDAVVGEQARKVLEDGQAMLKKIVEGRWLTANAVVGLYPANRVGDDDIAFWADEARQTPVLTWHGLRQQTEKQQEDDGSYRPSRCLADFVAPAVAINSGAAHADSTRAEAADGTASRDYAGLFAVTAGIGAEAREQAFAAVHDDYSAIMLKSLADRLAEAFAELLHKKVRTDWWGYAASETLDKGALIAEQYQGIRPAPGYPACPDHSVKKDLFALLQCEDIGMGLTDSMAMTPAASVSGFYIGHPEASYFSVGKVGADQVADMAARRGMDVDALQRFLAPNL